ncbi:MAG: bifunctional homocysteine S-methyltransferase/methylenetetrahydrofolate reductase [Planctomycetes bacterium]|nr:bifunctional homocysteine S-methyltransferase/methylenetetrahydrofolate reductase [Planctomycetota bacterium]
MCPDRSAHFLDDLDRRPMAFDGAMGTLLYESGYFINHSFDEANVTKPAAVLDCHKSYVEAGADVIESNTFSANRFLLARYGIADQVAAINRAGVEIAREAAGDKVYVAGSIGPTGEGLARISDRKAAEIAAAFDEQIQALVSGRPDLLILETFHHPEEMRIALRCCREHFAGPIVAQMSFENDFRLRDGTEPEGVADRLGQWGADVVGVNCALGPAHVFEIASRMVTIGLPVSAQPNAGIPRRLDERMIYMSTPEYFGVFARRFFKAGVRLVGGCCGTSPEHIKAVADACRMMGGSAIEMRERKTGPVPIQGQAIEPTPTEQKSRLAAKIRRVWQERLALDGPRKAIAGPEDFVVSVEVNPHPGLATDRAVAGARMLRDAGVDVVNIADGPRAVVRMSNWALGLTIQRELDMEFIQHVCCRDRNLLGLQADLLGSHVLGVRNLVIITGDPPKLGDYPKATAVFDLDSVELLKLVKALNNGIDPAGKMVGEATSFFCACGAEPGALSYDREIERLRAKIRNGAELIMTQPVYDPAVLDRFLRDTADLEVPILVGILPLASARNADFLHNEVPGMQIPAAIRQRMHDAPEGEEARAEGVRIAREMLEAVKDRVVGTYIMPPFSRYRAALEVLEPLGYSLPEES